VVVVPAACSSKPSTRPVNQLKGTRAVRKHSLCKHSLCQERSKTDA
jgi:hypothetical protein